jgi:hypothetical protein
VQRKKIDRLDRVFSTSLSTTREALRSTIGRVQYLEEDDEFLIVHESAENPTAFNKEQDGYLLKVSARIRKSRTSR